MSITSVIFPIIAALVAPEGTYFKYDNTWSAVNDTQVHFLKNFYTRRSELSFFNEKELRTWVSDNHEELNQILEQNGFDIRLEPFNGIGAVSIFDIILKWQFEGALQEIVYHENAYKGVELDEGFAVVKSNNYPHPIVKINTQNSDTVYMTIADFKPDTQFSLLEKIATLKETYDSGRFEKVDKILFPQVEINQMINLSWILGMNCPHITLPDPNFWEISQAYQQTKLKIDLTGAHVESAVVLGFECTSVNLKIPKLLIIDKPFYIWIERKGCSLPIFAGYITETDWVKYNDH